VDVSERLAWLRLRRTRTVGPVTFAQLLQRYGSASAALAALPELARRVGRELIPGSVSAAQAELAAADRADAQLLLSAEPAYPALLREIPDAPPILYLRGRVPDRALAVAIVGARNASALGARFARQLASECTEGGALVVSGLARGIDAAAHEGALAGGTLAVLGTGIDIPFPPENAALYDRILEAGGGIVSEYPPGAPAKPRQFIARNRIIAGLTRGVVVVEGAVRSGSLSTASFATDYGREVFAVPGSPLDPRAAGPNGLLRKGATLVERAADVLDVLAPLAPRPSAPVDALAAGEPAADATERVAALLGPSPVESDELARQARLDPAQLASVLLDLELAGRLRRHPGGKVSLE